MLAEFLTKVAVVSGVVYGLIEALKPIWDASKRDNLGDKIAAAGTGVGLCLLAGIDVFPVAGIPLAVPYVGSVLTGFLVVGGGKSIHDILGLVDTFRLARASGPSGVNG